MTHIQKNELKTIVSEILKIPEEKLSESSSITREFGLDSLAILRLICQIENTYEISIDERELDLLDNLGTAHKYINYLIEQKQ